MPLADGSAAKVTVVELPSGCIKGNQPAHIHAACAVRAAVALTSGAAPHVQDDGVSVDWPRMGGTHREDSATRALFSPSLAPPLVKINGREESKQWVFCVEK